MGVSKVLNDVIARPSGKEASDQDAMASGRPAASAPPVLSASGDAVVDLREAIRAKLAFVIGKSPETARERDLFAATALALRDRIVAACAASDPSVPNKRVYYLSL